MKNRKRENRIGRKEKSKRNRERLLRVVLISKIPLISRRHGLKILTFHRSKQKMSTRFSLNHPHLMLAAWPMMTMIPLKRPSQTFNNNKNRKSRLKNLYIKDYIRKSIGRRKTNEFFFIRNCPRYNYLFLH